MKNRRASTMLKVGKGIWRFYGVTASAQSILACPEGPVECWVCACAKRVCCCCSMQSWGAQLRHTHVSAGAHEFCRGQERSEWGVVRKNLSVLQNNNDGMRSAVSPWVRGKTLSVDFLLKSRKQRSCICGAKIISTNPSLGTNQGVRPHGLKTPTLFVSAWRSWHFKSAYAHLISYSGCNNLWGQQVLSLQTVLARYPGPLAKSSNGEVLKLTMRTGNEHPESYFRLIISAPA